MKEDITAAAEAEGRDAFPGCKNEQQANLINLAETIAKADASPCGCWAHIYLALHVSYYTVQYI